MKHLNKIVLVALAATMFSCDQDFEHPIEDIQVSKGEADFSTPTPVLSISCVSGAVIFPLCGLTTR